MTRTMSGAIAQQMKGKQLNLKDLAPTRLAAEEVKGGPSGQPWAKIKGRKS